MHEAAEANPEVLSAVTVVASDLVAADATAVVLVGSLVLALDSVRPPLAPSGAACG